MGNNRFFRSVWVRLGLGVLGFESVLVILTWLLNRYWFLQFVSFGDALLVMGVLACLVASAGMLRSPYGGMFSPNGVPAFPIQVSEEQKRMQRISEAVEQRSFAMRLLAAGLLNIFISTLVTYIH